MKKIWISLLNTDCYIRNDIKERKHGMIIDELKKQEKLYWTQEEIIL